MDMLKQAYEDAIEHADDDEWEDSTSDSTGKKFTPFCVRFPPESGIQDLIALKRGDGVNVLVKFLEYAYDLCGSDGFDKITKDGTDRQIIPLIVKEIPQGKEQYYKRVIKDNYYLNTYTGNNLKINQIKEVSKLLGLQVEVSKVTPQID